MLRPPRYHPVYTCRAQSSSYHFRPPAQGCVAHNTFTVEKLGQGVRDSVLRETSASGPKLGRLKH
jgi:hypothetical protein